ncbi:ABC transporter permease [Xinfangfangia sp. CPCC 101601]|uniref:ABC transporter permease n=1 Tax=Pseudogemmobacter lacusdianii TaxID=3069608 RepID=A0ABU0W0S5_9RHOB|nr:ABC transporter permease [Xinfangfangia sp. CPCC 101601]MDQ2067614.1 ABC transporter permease [Xinfangfangia sp. CPCC 101601]
MSHSISLQKTRGAGLSRLQLVLGLMGFIWLSLCVYVIFPDAFGAYQSYITLPAAAAVVAVYVLMFQMWRGSRIAIVGLSLVSFWIMVSVLVPALPLIDPNKPIAPFLSPGSSKDGLTFWLGTDMRGRDILSRALWGSQRILVWGITSTASAYFVGISLGLMAGYLRGWWDEVFSYLTNVLLSFPVMVLLILMLNYLGQSPFNVILAITCSSAPSIMRIVRGLALQERSRDYVHAAQVRGESALWIMVMEIVPNIRGPLIVDACLRLGYTTVAITTLTFLGLGLQPPDPDWGLMIREATSSAMVWKFAYMLIIPSLSITTLILGFNLIADGLRELSLRD